MFFIHGRDKTLGISHKNETLPCTYPSGTNSGYYIKSTCPAGYQNLERGYIKKKKKKLKQGPGMVFIRGRATTLRISHMNETLPCTNVSRETFVPVGDQYWFIT